MKAKNLKKKIRRLEKRLQEGPRKLARLKTKLEMVEAVEAKEGRRKLAARTRSRLTAQPSKKKRKTVPAKKPIAKKKAKRKLNLSPERRAQLAAAMRARWAAKKAAAEPGPEIASTGQVFTLEQAPPAAETKPDGADERSSSS